MCCQHREAPGWGKPLALIVGLWLAGVPSFGDFPVSEELTLLPIDPVMEASGGGPGDFPVELILDDNTAEGVFGLADSSSRQFLWFNRFAYPVGGQGFSLQEIQVLFPAGQEIEVGDAVQLVVYRDDDDDPADGAELLLTLDEVVQAVDGETFSRFVLGPSLSINRPGDILIGVINRYYQAGIDPPDTRPAALDTSASQDRSWVALWVGDPPPAPELPADMAVVVLDGAISGNWMIRGFGSSAPVIEVPSLTPTGLAILSLLLALAGLARLTRRRRASVSARRFSAGRKGTP